MTSTEPGGHRTEIAQPFARRRSGILLHPSSLPGPRGFGSLGADAFRFVDFLSEAGQTVWQVLPLGPTLDGGSPYQCLSVHAGNARLINLERLLEEGWFPESGAAAVGAAEVADDSRVWDELLAGFRERGDESGWRAYEAFAHENGDWLDDYALFVALRERFGHAAWTGWPVELRDRHQNALDEARAAHHDTIERVRFQQFVFHRQWHALKAHANARGVLLFGDMPIFVAHDSVDVWVNRELFNLDDSGEPRVVAGVPPDYFSSTGQRWGNPHYLWDVMARNGYHWWIRRIASHLEMFDLLRIDHFRGFEAFWEIPADRPDAIGGRWVAGPREALFDALVAHFGSLPLVAEDLGMITPEVLELRDRYQLPGMKILQFAFDGSPDNPYLPHNHVRNCVVYTGTHDNDTGVGWFAGLDANTRAYVEEYLGHPGEEMPWPLIRSAMASPAALSIVPMQDVLALDGSHRMNVPGTTEGNWRWRFDWAQVPDDLAGRLARLASLYGR